MTPEQYLALERESADHLRPLNRFRVCCGARLGEALSLDWREVDLGAGHVIFLPDKTKGRKKRIAALTPSAIEALEIGRAHVCTPVTNEHLVCRLLLTK